jgi:hypothetical protein
MEASTLHRTQIYLQASLHERLKLRARNANISMSELIRRTLEAQTPPDRAADAKAFFDRLEPLDSFAGVDAQAHVQDLRSRSRLLRTPSQD